MLPMLEFAKATGQSVIVLNPNMDIDPFTQQQIAHCGTMIEHCKFVWESFISKANCPAETLAIVAHSAGGRCVGALFKDYQREFLDRVRCLVFTDAYYHSMLKGLPESTLDVLKSYSIHFKAYK